MGFWNFFDMGSLKSDGEFEAEYWENLRQKIAKYGSAKAALKADLENPYLYKNQAGPTLMLLALAYAEDNGWDILSGKPKARAA